VGTTLGTIAITIAAGAYLRDPPWLIDVTSGLSRSFHDAQGRRYRWTGGRASFFVPAETRGVRIPLRTPRGDEEAVAVRIDLNDRPVALVALQDASWTEARVAVPPGSAGRRHVVRVDLRIDRTWGPLSRGVQVGDIGVE
jgi:hypothetical protein